MKIVSRKDFKKGIGLIHGEIVMVGNKKSYEVKPYYNFNRKKIYPATKFIDLYISPVKMLNMLDGTISNKRVQALKQILMNWGEVDLNSAFVYKMVKELPVTFITEEERTEILADENRN